MVHYLILGFLFLFNISCSNSQQPETTMQLPVSKLPAEDAEPRSPIMASYDAGMSWKPAGQGLPSNTELTFMKMKGDKIIAATDNEGLFISADNFKTWKQIGNGLPAKKILSLFILNEDIYVSVFQKGIYFSNDEGESWSCLNYDLPELNVQSLWKKEDRLIAGTDSGIFNLEDGKQKWKAVFSNSQIVSLNSYEDKLVAGGVTGLYLSEDQGQNWKSIHNAGAIHYLEIIDGKIFGMYISGDVFISEDWGTSWISAKYEPRAGSYTYDIAKVDDQYILSNNYGIHRSTDGGKTFEHIYFQEAWGIFEFLVKDGVLYGGTRAWQEYRGKSR